MSRLNITTEGIYILLGSNLGDRSDHLSEVKLKIDGCDNIHLKRSSPIYESSPWGISNQPKYLNQVLEIETDLTPYDLLIKLLSIENSMGRTRNGQKWGSRIIDIDILYYHQKIIEQKGLILPHPQLHNRRFTLIPLCDLNSKFLHPVLKKTNAQLLDECKDPLMVDSWEAL